jgi:hypothetical protein
LSEASDALDAKGENCGKVLALGAVVRFLGAIDPENSRPRLPFRLMLMDMTAAAEGFDEKGARLWEAHARIAAAVEAMTSPVSGVDRTEAILWATRLAAEAATTAGVPIGRAGSIEQQVDKAISKKKAEESVKNIWRNFKKANTASTNTGKRRVPDRIYSMFLVFTMELETSCATLGYRDRIEVLAVDLLNKLQRYKPAAG